MGGLEDDWSIRISSSFESGNDSGGRGHVLWRKRSVPRLAACGSTHDGGNSIVVLLSMLEQGQDIVTNDDTLLARQNVLETHVDNCWVGLRM